MATLYHVYSNNGAGPIDYAHPIATVDGTTTRTSSLTFPATWRFGVRAFDDVTGLEEQGIAQAVAITFGDNGADISGQPSAPAGLTLLTTSNGSMRVRWTYPLSGNQPIGFRVYVGTLGVPDYTTPVATVFGVGRSMTPTYSASISGLSDGVTYTVGVRSYNASGEEANAISVSAIARVVGPAIVGSLTATAIS